MKIPVSSCPLSIRLTLKLCSKSNGYLFEGILLIYFISLTKHKYHQKIWTCSNILSLYQKVNPFYAQKVYTDQPQATVGLSASVEVVIKCPNSFYKK